MRDIIDHIIRNRIMCLRYSIRRHPGLIRMLIEIEDVLAGLNVIGGMR
jgi:hypothetical protein